jgi:class 3 adenylate cyclase
VRAVRAALTLRERWQRTVPDDHCAIKVGLHTGTALTGMVATERRADYVAVGEPVNTAAWLVGLAAADQVLVTSKTLSAVSKRFEVEPLGERAVNERNNVAVYQVLSELQRSTHPGV